MRTLESLIKKHGGWNNVKRPFAESEFEDEMLEEIKKNIDYINTKVLLANEKLTSEQIDIFIKALKAALDEICNSRSNLNLKSKNLPRCVILKILKYTYCNDISRDDISNILKPAFLNNGKHLTKGVIINIIDKITNNLSQYFVFSETDESEFWFDLWYKNKFNRELFDIFVEGNPKCKEEIEDFIKENNIE